MTAKLLYYLSVIFDQQKGLQMANTPRPEDSRKIMPTALDYRKVASLNFGNQDAASEAEGLIVFLQNRDQGWMPFTDSDFHDSVCGIENCDEHRNEERWFMALSTRGLLMFANGQYHITKQFVDICAAATFE
jgi:hypothetical protein